jgi:acyl dehydratase
VTIRETSNVIPEVDFRDIDGLNQFVGRAWGEYSGELTVTQEMIDQFAALSGDHQWIHVDVERAARESPFGATIAQGFLLLCLLPRVRPPANLVIAGHQRVLNYGGETLRFLSPMIVNERLRARERTVSVQKHSKGTLVTTEIQMQSVNNEAVVLVYRLQLLYC